ncbi:MAG: fibrillarin-like rRNA/tRNA 2'-O-methyltransferase [Candidatus Hodarchaeota archaeon]
MSNIEIRSHPRFYNVYISGKPNNLKLYTRNLVPGVRVYGEKLITFKSIEYREWDPFRSKLAALLLENPKINLFSHDLKCLYLGASSGTTISHLSDILFQGVIFGVEVAPRSIRQLIQNISDRKNIIPILGDANFPEKYAKSIFSKVDLIYQDVAQPNQAEIAISNCKYYLKRGGYLVITIKSQSINSIRRSEKVYEKEKSILRNAGYEIIENLNIHKYAANHIVLIIKEI